MKKLTAFLELEKGDSRIRGGFDPVNHLALHVERKETESTRISQKTSLAIIAALLASIALTDDFNTNQS
jgi:hypothetical protein